MMESFTNFFEQGPLLARSFAPGRTELAGNHVDHQGGVVLTGALSFGTEALAKANNLNCWRVMSNGFEPFVVLREEIMAQDGPEQKYEGTPKALVLGVLRQMWRAKRNQDVPENSFFGIDLQVKSNLPVGGGLSSSASFEMMVAALANLLYFSNSFDSISLAKIAQVAECNYFGKPCGLMDQAAIALGGIAQIDFADELSPQVRVLNADFSSLGLDVVLIDLHADHAATTSLFAQIPADMKKVAEIFNQTRLVDVSESIVMKNVASIRSQVGDLALLRALHYYNEVRLVQARAVALEEKDAVKFLDLTRQSAASSASFLRNVELPESNYQPALIILAYGNALLHSLDENNSLSGAIRIHGGGFGGSVQAFVPRQFSHEFCSCMNDLLGVGSAYILNISARGAQAKWLN